MPGETEIDYAALADQIAGWLSAHAKQAGADRLVVGLSGGIDSAVVCALCTMAVGPARVVAAIMPILSREDDRRAAEAVARAFEVRAQFIDLTPTFGTFLAAMPDEDAAGLDDASADSEDRDARRGLAVANVKPRLRMTTLYYLANRSNGLVVGTGNKTELSIGYFTKYGDGGVDLLPLGDLDKTAVRELARALGVPEAIVTKVPSAGLWEGQTDEGEIGLAYETLDGALRAIATGNAGELAADTLQRVTTLMAVSEHKRRSIPVFRRDESRITPPR